MSLQQIPPNHPISEKSYTLRLFEYAWKETREHDKVEMIAATIIPTLAAFIGGFTWSGAAAGIVAAVATLTVTLCVIFLIHFLRAPKILNTQLQEQLKRQVKLLDELQSQKLTFELDVPRSQVNVSGNLDVFDVRLHLHIRFLNSDIHPLMEVDRQAQPRNPKLRP